jgi:hypothetical protein
MAVNPQFQINNKSKEKYYRWLLRIYKFGLIFYRGIIYRFFQIISQFIADSLIKKWFMKAAERGSFFVIESLRTDYPNLYNRF